MVIYVDQLDQRKHTQTQYKLCFALELLYTETILLLYMDLEMHLSYPKTVGRT
jgi:hypothetical protein